MSRWNKSKPDFNILIGQTLIRVEGLEDGSEEVIFTTNKGNRYIMYHEQDCCESVAIEDIHGDVESLIGSKITHAEEVTNSEDYPDGVEKPKDDGWGDDSFTWTYYYIRTEAGSISIRWYGSSNGHYSERVDFIWDNNPLEAS